MLDNLTVRGVAKNLAISPYTYSYDNIQLNFSSEFNLKRFNERLIEHTENIKYRAFRLFGFNINISKITVLLSLYIKIEKRGFYVKINNVEYLNIDKISL